MSNSVIKSFQSYEFILLTRQNLNTNINIRDNLIYLKYKYLIAQDKMLTQGYN